MLDISTLETWLWDAACQIRGPLDAPKFKDYILPLVSLKRLSDVFEDELDRLGAEFGDPEMAAALVAGDHALVRFYVPTGALWAELARRTSGLGEYLTDAVRAVARENARLQGVIDMVDFNATTSGQRTVSGCATWSRIFWAAPTSTCCASSPRGRGRAPGSSTPRPRLPPSWRESSIPSRA